MAETEKPDALLHWHQYAVGGGYWKVQVLNPAMRDGAPLYGRPLPPPPAPAWVYRQMQISVPEGGEVTLTFPEPMSAESVDMLEECLALLFRRFRRAATARSDSGEQEYASWAAHVSDVGGSDAT